MALATPEDVTAKLEDEPTERMLVMIEQYLEDASDEARYHGREWADTDAPNAVKRMVATAVARFMRNPERLAQTRAGDETLAFQDTEIDWFTDLEIERLGRLAAPAQLPGFGTIQMVAFNKSNRRRRTDDAIYVPTSGGAEGKPFPFLTKE